MSDLGLGNLISLKRHLLAGDLQTRTTWDTPITDIGRGVAGALEKFCNRLWVRTTDGTDIFSADRASWILQRYPVESISAVDLRSDLNTGWVTMGAVATAILNWSAASGLVHFGAVQGESTAQIRITYTGGYWYDTAEAENTTQPAGSTLVPYVVRQAWFLQCEKVWQVLDPLGRGIVSGGSGTRRLADADGLVGLSLAGLELVPLVKQMIAPFVRYAIT